MRALAVGVIVVGMVCALPAAVVTQMSSDEQALRNIEQQIAQATSLTTSA